MELVIGKRKVGQKYKPFVIAELSANHLHKLEIALELVHQAYKCGADAFKIQTLKPETMTIDCDNEFFTINAGSPWDGRKLIDLYSETPLPYEWHEPIFQECKKLGIECFSTAYDLTALEFLDRFDPPAYKIASFEIFDLELIEETAKRMKPIIISTGVAELEDIENAIKRCRLVGNNQIILLKCTSAYPTPFSEVNLNTMVDYQERFNVLTGVSDHTISNSVPFASVALGGVVIEKHFTLDRKLGGPDSLFSIEPSELSSLTKGVKEVFDSLGTINYNLSEKVLKNKKFARSLFVVKDVKRNEILTRDNIRAIRPGDGLKPVNLEKILGKRASREIKAGTPLSWELINE